MSSGGHDDGRPQWMSGWPFAQLFPSPLQAFGFALPQGMMSGMPPMATMPMGGMALPGMAQMAGMMSPGGFMSGASPFTMPFAGFPMPGGGFAGMAPQASPAASPAAAPTAAGGPLPTQFLQQMTRVNLEMFALLTRRTRAMMEAPLRFSQCRTVDDVSNAQTAFMHEMLADFTSANQRIMAIWNGAAANGQPTAAKTATDAPRSASSAAESEPDTPASRQEPRPPATGRGKPRRQAPARKPKSTRRPVARTAATSKSPPRKAKSPRRRR